MLKILNVSLSLALAGILAACASSSPDVIQRGDTQRLAQVQDGVVLSVRTGSGGWQSDWRWCSRGRCSGCRWGATPVAVYSVKAQVLGVLAGVAGAAAGNAIERFSTREDAVGNSGSAQRR
jgi:outer membrane lipoprotein SlyB